MTEPDGAPDAGDIAARLEAAFEAEQAAPRRNRRSDSMAPAAAPSRSPAPVVPAPGPGARPADPARPGGRPGSAAPARLSATAEQRRQLEGLAVRDAEVRELLERIDSHLAVVPSLEAAIAQLLAQVDELGEQVAGLSTRLHAAQPVGSTGRPRRFTGRFLGRPGAAGSG